MKIILQQIGKQYDYQWVFKNIDLEVASGQQLALEGRNGAGKSTLLKIISGYLTPSKGEVQYFADDVNIRRDDVYKKISMAAPYIELFEDLSVKEIIQMQAKLRPFQDDMKAEDIMEWCYLDKADGKLVRQLSSGMKQRLKLTLAILSTHDLLLLDEPGTNLDAQGLEWYHRSLDKFVKSSTVIIASNVESDFHKTEARFRLENA
jgi:ABC-2 type transport system ATP-binding protein